MRSLYSRTSCAEPVYSSHGLRQLADAPFQLRRPHHPRVGPEPEDPAHHLRTEAHSQPDVHPPGPLERFLRAVPAVARHERFPRADEAHLDVLDGILLLDRDPEAVREDALGIVAVLVGIRERASYGIGGLDSGKAVGMGLCVLPPPDDVELVVVDRERERLDADRPPRALEVPVAELEGAAPLERVHHLLEQLLVLGERFLAAADDEDELAAEILEPLGMEGVAGQVVDEVVHALLVARPL